MINFRKYELAEVKELGVYILTTNDDYLIEYGYSEKALKTITTR